MVTPLWAGPNLDETELRLSWSAPAECPTTEDVRAATLDNAGARAKRQTAPLEADALVERARDSGWRVRLRTRRGGAIGERDIEASTCRGVADATAVVLALALVNVASGQAAGTDGPLVSSEPPRSEATETTRARDAKTPKAHRTEPLLALGAGVAVDASTLPTATFGGGANLALTLSRLRLEVEGQRFASQSKSVAQSNAGASFSMSTLGGRACLSLLKTPRSDLSPCVGANAVLLGASGFGADANYDRDTSLVSVTGGALGRIRLASWFALRASVNAFVPLSRPTFLVENEGDVHRPPTLGATAAAGVEVNFL